MLGLWSWDSRLCSTLLLKTAAHLQFYNTFMHPHHVIMQVYLHDMCSYDVCFSPLLSFIALTNIKWPNTNSISPQKQMIMYFYLFLDFTLFLFCELMVKNRQNKYTGLLKTINHSDNEWGRTVQDISLFQIKLLEDYEVNQALQWNHITEKKNILLHWHHIRN